jgi:hypothetical protein
MKKLLVTLAAVLVSASTSGQGTINFNNLVSAATPPINAPVFRADGVTQVGLAPGGASAQLYVSVGGGAFTPVPTVLQFRTAGAAAGYVNNPTAVQVPGVAGGTAVQVQMRAWETGTGATWEAATIKGQSATLNLTLGGAGSPPSVPADLVGLTSFSMIPEPSTMALGLLGAAALLYRRRS